MSEIFPESIEPAMLFTRNLANPVHVQTAETIGAQHDRRPYTRLDLIALANTIVRIEKDHVEIAHEITNLRTVIENQRITIERLSAVVKSPVVWKFLTSLAGLGQPDMSADDDQYEDPEDLY